MRTTIAAALALMTVAACGGDDGLSLTEPNQLEYCADAPAGFDFTGAWQIDEWGCMGVPGQGQALNCTASHLRWSNGDDLTMTGGPDVFTMTIDGYAMTINRNGVSDLNGEIDADNSMLVLACADGRMMLTTVASEDFEQFAAFADRR